MIFVLTCHGITTITKLLLFLKLKNILIFLVLISNMRNIDRV